MDRIDMHVEVPSVPRELMRNSTHGNEDVRAEDSQTVRNRVELARERQIKRGHRPNAMLGNREVERHCAISEADSQLLERAIEQLGLSARAYHRILKVARTIADLAGSPDITTAHLTEAIGYRRLDRGGMN